MIDDQGVALTVALPDPGEVMADGFRRDLDALVASQRSEVEDVLEVTEARLFEGDLSLHAEPEGDALFEEGGAGPQRLHRLTRTQSQMSAIAVPAA